MAPSWLRPRRAATAIEFALTLPVMIALIGGIMDVSWLFFQKATLDSAAHLGCRAAATVDPGDNLSDWSDVRQTAQDAIAAQLTANGVPADAATISVTWWWADTQRCLTCTVEAPYHAFFGVIPSMDMVSRAIVRMEVQR